MMVLVVNGGIKQGLYESLTKGLLGFVDGLWTLAREGPCFVGVFVMVVQGVYEIPNYGPLLEDHRTP